MRTPPQFSRFLGFGRYARPRTSSLSGPAPARTVRVREIATKDLVVGVVVYHQGRWLRVEAVICEAMEGYDFVIGLHVVRGQDLDAGEDGKVVVHATENYQFVRWSPSHPLADEVDGGAAEPDEAVASP